MTIRGKGRLPSWIANSTCDRRRGRSTGTGSISSSSGPGRWIHAAPKNRNTRRQVATHSVSARASRVMTHDYKAVGCVETWGRREHYPAEAPNPGRPEEGRRGTLGRGALRHVGRERYSKLRSPDGTT